MCNNNAKLDRRQLLQSSLQWSAAVGVASFVGSKNVFGAAPEESASQKEPHFFLHINIPAGVDARYLFDARPLLMTEQKVAAFYHKQAPILLTGSNGQTTLRTSLTDPLMKWFDRFSIVNGVVMSPTFQGHDQLANVLLTGNPFGGESFIPWANDRGMPLDYIQTSTYFASLSNTSGGMQLSPDTCRGLAKRISSIGQKSRVLDGIKNRANLQASGKSTLASSSRRLASSVDSIPNLAQKFAQLNLKSPPIVGPENSEANIVEKAKGEAEMITELMRTGVTRSGMLIINQDIDSHSQKSAARLPVTLGAVCKAIAAVFEHLSQTPSPSGRSMFDDTTIMIGTEFSRTLRQNRDFAESGTDHNPLTNTLIVGGKGFKGGLVVGKSDFNSAEEVLSAAHLKSDPERLSIMGLPFDHSTGQVIESLRPEVFEESKYLVATNVTNTLQQVLGIPSSKRFLRGRGLPAADVIPSLIA